MWYVFAVIFLILMVFTHKLNILVDSEFGRFDTGVYWV